MRNSDPSTLLRAEHRYSASIRTQPGPVAMEALGGLVGKIQQVFVGYASICLFVKPNFAIYPLLFTLQCD
jgi:hypothetical protein